jgi:RNA polymerase sigma-70 factor (ECF subfamily)
MDEQQSDQDLIRQVLAGDRQAFGTLVERYQQAVYRIVYRLVGSVQEAEDLTQEAFISCYRHLNRYDASRPFTPWLYRIAANLAVSRLRHLQRLLRFTWEQCFYSTFENIAAAAGKEPENQYTAQETRQALLLDLNQLNPKDRAVITLRYFEELSYQEIAFILQTRPNTVEVRLHRARKKLRLIMERTAKGVKP